MKHLTPREKELIHELFSPRIVDQLIKSIPGTSEDEWTTIYSKLLTDKSPIRRSGSRESLQKELDLVLYVDGAADLHNGTAGIGGILYRKQTPNSPEEELYTFSENIGKATSNEAEYIALIRGLEYAKKFNCHKIAIRADSELVVKQLNLEYKVKNERIRKLYQKVRTLLKDFDSWKIIHINRTKNKKADILSHQGMREGSKEK